HPEVFLAYLASIRKPDGSLLTSAGYGTHRASLFNLFRDYNEKIPEEFTQVMSGAFKGLKRKLADMAQRGDENIKVGKDPLSFDFYQFLCKELISLPGK